ncbi:MAG: YhfC family glutamic-type intramembrane protease [Eubacteriales bacterium]|nr:YhfC family glutamic-type intramembrane protease [Eubacteriales bacterium]
MTDYGYVETASIVWMVIGLFVFLVVPVALSLIWIIKKKERVTTILVGAAAFILFALILEKPIQNVLLFPTAMGLSDHAISIFMNSHPVLLAFMVGLFPGVFEETGRLIAYKTVLKKRTNKETSISYGIGHGGIEVIAILGLTYVNYIAYAVMINTGTFQTLVDQLMAQAPGQIGQVDQMVSLLTTFSCGKVMLDVVERIFAVMFHIGASVLVFYACRDKGKFWLYPLAIVIHTVTDFVGGLVIFNVISISDWGMEFIVAIIGIVTIFGSYLLLYKKDNKTVAIGARFNTICKK